MTYERRTVLTLRSLPPVNAGYERWFPELRRAMTQTHATRSAAATDAYPKRWLPDVAAQFATRQERPRVSR
ncbi:MAG TPA: hypothetical protein VFJ77_03815 [Gaiellaceae bacterium]|nr:hypothetical protein [Gaiellaceae bacterium]